MNHINSVLLEGVLTDAPKEINLKSSEQKLVKFDIASDRHYTRENGEKATETLFIPVQCWNLIGDKVLKYLSKGMTVRVVGRLRLSRWETADGSSRRTIELVAHHIEFKKKQNDGSDSPMEIDAPSEE